MPVGGKPLPESTINALAAAIDSMQPAKSAAAPSDAYMKWLFAIPTASKAPDVKNTAWIRNPIDAFVLAKLEEKGLAPAPAADKRALLRRVYFDLIGLPPTVEEAEAFRRTHHPTRTKGWSTGFWLTSATASGGGVTGSNLVRFAESDGFAIDGERPTAWRYRDYVIRAFNSDKPYDVFIQEQIAGDEMERRGGNGRGMAEASEGPVALGYLRMGPWEADANFDDQLRLDWLNEMTTTTSQVFLGMTVGCARCHDHKYDPIPQRDFYRMQAFFASTRIEDRPARSSM